MRFIQALRTGVLAALTVSVSAWNRLDKDNAALLIIDHQVGLTQVVRDYTVNDFRNNMLAHAAIGKTFGIPVVMTSSSDEGPNGQILKEILEMYPDVKLIRRQGEVNAWDNEEFRRAVEETGRKQLIVGGIVTEVCTTFLALSLIDEGYEVYANTEASGTFDIRLAEDANRRMEKAGVTLMGFFAIVCDLMRDWRNVPGLTELLPFLDQYLFAYGLLARHHAAAIVNGTLAEVENLLI
ncbi:putative isochorismatase family hydrolase [Aspergillus stella-maris]|uniref:putative isochorismatase family hydrolase n=1 Tax=Aspergillus stella-maris TaxID=1810926 RepID=UPI003CCD6BA2